MPATARKDWADRALASVTPEEVAAQARLVTLAMAPVPKPPTYGRLNLAGQVRVLKVYRSAAAVSVPAESWERHGRLADIVDDPAAGLIRGNTGNDRAAVRAELTGPAESGEPNEHGAVVLVAILLEVSETQYRTVVAEGTWSAIANAFPDRATLKAWKAAGVSEIPVYLDESQARTYRELHVATLVPIDQAPRVVQMERLSRSLAAQ